jgi:hypothetical protein
MSDFAFIKIGLAEGDVLIDPDLPNTFSVTVDEGSEAVTLTDAQIDLIQRVRAVALGQE